MMEENVLTIIKRDHEKAREEIAELEAMKTAGPAAENPIFATLQKEELGHLKAEEDLVFPLIKKEEKDLIKDAENEHKEIRSSLKKLSKSTIGDDTWVKELKTMKRTIEHHIKDEEGPIFAGIRQKVNTTTLQELGPKFKLDENFEQR